MSVTAHLIVAARAVAVVVMLVGPVRSLPDDAAPTDVGRSDAARRAALRRTLATWREPRTLLIGLFVLAFAFAEGAGIDWISVAVIDGYGVPATVGTLAFAMFLAAMTVGRWFGPGLLDRYGRVPVVRVLAADQPGRPGAVRLRPEHRRSPSPARCSGVWARRWASRSA